MRRVDQYKYLGTTIDEELNGEARYNRILQVLSFRKQTFSKIFFFFFFFY